MVTLTLEGLELAGHVDTTVAVVTYVKRYHADRVAGDEKLFALFVVEGKGEDARETLEHGNDVFIAGVAAVGKEVAVEGEDRLAVATCGEGVGVGILGA